MVQHTLKLFLVEPKSSGNNMADHLCQQAGRVTFQKNPRDTSTDQIYYLASRHSYRDKQHLCDEAPAPLPNGGSPSRLVLPGKNPGAQCRWTFASEPAERLRPTRKRRQLRSQPLLRGAEPHLPGTKRGHLPIGS